MGTRFRQTSQLTTATNEVIKFGQLERNYISLAVEVTGDGNYTVQASLDGNTWFDHETLAAATATANDKYVVPVAAVRLVVNSITTGYVQLTALGS